MMPEAEICDDSTPVYYSSNRGGTKLELKGFVYNKDRTVESKIYWCYDNRAHHTTECSPFHCKT